MTGSALRGGHEPAAKNRTTGRTAEVAAAGAAVAASIAEVCTGAEIVITMLAHDAALEEIVHADGGLLASLADDAIHMPMCTHSVATTDAIASAHCAAGKLFVPCRGICPRDAAASV